MGEIKHGYDAHLLSHAYHTTQQHPMEKIMWSLGGGGEINMSMMPRGKKS